MALKAKKSGKKSSTTVDEEQIKQYLGGLSMAGFLMASSNGEISEEEYEVLAQLVAGFIEGASYEQVNDLLDAHSTTLDENGWDECVAALGSLLDGEEIQTLALELVTAVALSDGDFSEDQEGAAYLQIASGIGVEQEAALAIFKRVIDEFNA
jgi:tellurite resistance protein